MEVGIVPTRYERQWEVDVGHGFLQGWILDDLLFSCLS